MGINEVLGWPVEGLNLRPGTLGDQLDSRPTLVVFLRHLGCPFSRELLTDLKGRAEGGDGFPPVLFVAMGTPAEVQSFAEGLWPGARVVSDPEQRLYRAFDVPRAGLGQLLGPKVWACGIRAIAKGHLGSKPIGDVMQMPAFLVLDGTNVVWRHVPRHAADHPDFGALPEVATGASTA
jgi:hypothetical protein